MPRPGAFPGANITEVSVHAARVLQRGQVSVPLHQSVCHASVDSECLQRKILPSSTETQVEPAHSAVSERSYTPLPRPPKPKYVLGRYGFGGGGGGG